MTHTEALKNKKSHACDSIAKLRASAWNYIIYIIKKEQKQIENKMKKIYTLFMTAVLLVLGSGNASAITYEDITWSQYATTLSSVITTNESNPTYVYLYNADEGKFLTNGGNYGMEGILSEVGMRFYITQVSNIWGTYYEVHSTIDNSDHKKSNLLGMDSGKSTVYFDRGKTSSRDDTNYSSWTFSNGNAYTISQSISNSIWSSTTYYWNYEGKKLVGSTSVNANTANKWYIITYDDYKKVLESLEDDYVDISGVILDSHFDRNSKDASYWKFSASTDSYIYEPYFVAAGTDSKDEIDGAFVTARLGNEVTTLTQTITGLQPGRYRVTCQGFYNNNGSDNECAYLVADGGVTGETGKRALQIAEADEAETLSGYNKKNTTDETNRAIAAGKIFAKDDAYADGSVEDPYFNEVFVTVSEAGTLTIGISKECADGEVYVDNFRLFIVNEKQTNTKLYLSANQSNEEKIDMNGYKSAYDCYLRRSFTLNAWEPLCLPFDITFQQLTDAFGTGVELCELQGIKDGSMIVFSPVSISETASSYVKANHCYVIKVTNSPVYTVNETTPEFTNLLYTTATTMHGPIYVIPDVKQDAREFNVVSGTAQEGDFTTANFTCYYKKATVEAPVYIESAGKMYNVTDGTATVYGTTWVITETSDDAMSISIDGADDSTSSISGVVLNGINSTNAKVYNLNGMMVGTASQKDKLQKGIYIINGKKYVVR